MDDQFKLLKIDQDNLERIRDIVPPEVAENIGRTWYRALTLKDMEDNFHCADICGDGAQYPVTE